MHSSRMRTSRSLTVCCSLLPGGDVCLVRGGGSPWSWGVSVWYGGVSLVWGVLPARRGVSAWSQGRFSLVRGGSPCQGGGGCLPGPGGRGCLPGLGGFSLVPGGCLPGPRGFSGDPPVYRITDTCKNITLATTSLRPVKSTHRNVVTIAESRATYLLTVVSVRVLVWLWTVPIFPI